MHYIAFVYCNKISRHPHPAFSLAWQCIHADRLKNWLFLFSFIGLQTGLRLTLSVSDPIHPLPLLLLLSFPFSSLPLYSFIPSRFSAILLLSSTQNRSLNWYPAPLKLFYFLLAASGNKSFQLPRPKSPRGIRKLPFSLCLCLLCPTWAKLQPVEVHPVVSGLWLASPDHRVQPIPAFGAAWKTTGRFTRGEIEQDKTKDPRHKARQGFRTGLVVSSRKRKEDDFLQRFNSVFRVPL